MSGQRWVVVIATCLLPVFVSGWSNAEADMFGLVEEIGENFYTVLGVSDDATAQEIKKAYRKMSLKYHPDKSSDPGAKDKFRQINAISEVLGSDELRKSYDHILIHGLPTWRQPVFYYAKAKQIGLPLLIALTTVFACGVQHLIHHLQYAELRKGVETRRARQAKKGLKDSLEPLPPPPQLLDLFPAQLILHSPWLCLSLLQACVGAIARVATKLSPPPAPAPAPAPTYTRPETEPAPQPPRPPPQVAKIEAAGQTIASHVTLTPEDGDSHGGKREMKPSGAPWTADDLTALFKACKKHVRGTSNRWQLIADDIGREDVGEVINQSKLVGSSVSNTQQMKQKLAKAIQSTQTSSSGVTAPTPHPAPSTYAAVAKPDTAASSGKWSQEEQSLLEKAMRDNPSGKFSSVEERWRAIAALVPSRSYQDCFARFKVLREALKKSKQS